MIAQLAGAWGRTRHALGTPRLWRSMLQTAGALGVLWVAGLLAWHGYHPTHSGSSPPAPANPPAGAPPPPSPELHRPGGVLLWTLVGALGLGGIVVIPGMTGALYATVAAVVAGREASPSRPRGFWWVRGICWIGSFVLYSVGAIVAAVFAGGYGGLPGLLIVGLAVMGTLPFLLRWFGGLFAFAGDASLCYAGRASVQLAAYPTFLVGAVGSVAVLAAGTGLGWWCLQGIGWPAWLSAALSFLTVDVVLDLALTAWYLALYTTVATPEWPGVTAPEARGFPEGSSLGR